MSFPVLTTYTAVQHLQVRCPALYALGEAGYGYWLNDAYAAINPIAGYYGWGNSDRQNLATALLAAHNWTRSNSAGATDIGDGQIIAPSPGAIVNQTTGRESFGFGSPGYGNVTPAANEQEWTTTVYGRQLLQLIRTRPQFGSYAVNPGW